jgi:hypothetical protein
MKLGINVNPDNMALWLLKKTHLGRCSAFDCVLQLHAHSNRHVGGHD